METDVFFISWHNCVFSRLLTPPGTPLGSDSHSSLAAPKITSSARASSASKASRVRTVFLLQVFFPPSDLDGNLELQKVAPFVSITS